MSQLEYEVYFIEPGFAAVAIAAFASLEDAAAWAEAQTEFQLKRPHCRYEVHSCSYGPNGGSCDCRQVNNLAG